MLVSRSGLVISLEAGVQAADEQWPVSWSVPVDWWSVGLSEASRMAGCYLQHQLVEV